jgi:uncharacterized lipoprotein YmbA
MTHTRRSCTRLLTALVLLAMLSGCGSSPTTQFVSLETVPPSAGPQSFSGPPVSVGEVHLPPELDRPALVRRLGDYRLDVMGTVRWPASLDAIVQRTLALDVAARLPLGRTVLPGQPTPHEGLRLFLVTFETFAAGPNRKMTLKAWWWLVDDQSRATLLTRTSQIQVPLASDSGSDIAAAMSRALGQLADEMVQALASIPQKPE